MLGVGVIGRLGGRGDTVTVAVRMTARILFECISLAKYKVKFVRSLSPSHIPNLQGGKT